MTCTVVYNTEQLSQSQPGQVLLSSSEFPLEVCRQPARDEKKQLPTQLYYSVSLEKGLKPCDAQVFPGYHQQPKQKNSQVPEPQPWWESQLAVGIHKTLRKKEKMLDTIKMASPQLHKRINMVEFTSNICKYLPFSDTTRHLAVLLLDHFMEKHSIMDFRLKLVSLTCLLVAAKMEDRDDCLPSIGHLKTLAKLDNQTEYSRENFQKMELYLMKFFDWSVSYPTATHFIGYYNSNCCQLDDIESNDICLPDLPFCLGGSEDVMSDLTMIDDPVCNSDIVVNMKDLEMALTPLQCEQSNAKSFRYQLEEITGSLLEKALRDYRFLHFPPSLVAAGAVCVARIYLQRAPVWTSRLEHVSAYTLQDLKPVIELFY